MDENRSKAPSSGERHDPGKAIGLYAGPVLFGVILFTMDLKPGDPVVTRMAAVAVWMAVWWITEAVPLAATALLPIVLFPVLGIMTGAETAPIYTNNIIFLFVGGFMIALAMEKWNLHKRIALWIIRVIGGGPSRLVLSFMLASALLSMWISNTATAIMMLAIGMAIVSETEGAFGRERTRPLSVGIMLGIAYGCSIGGISTLVGTPPNMVFVGIFGNDFPEAPAIGFGRWMLMAVPLSAIMFMAAWYLLTRVFFRTPPDLKLGSEVVDREYRALGRIRFAEVVVLIVFGMTALLWVFRKDLNVGVFVIPGWGTLLPYPDSIDDGTVAITMALLLFLIPSRARGAGESRSVLSLQVFWEIPWHLVLLFGGGFALAEGFAEAGLSAVIGEKCAGLEGTSPVVMIAGVSATLTFLTELTSNVATTQMILPILASISRAMQLNPLLLMIPATLSASFAFMMPVATPPNAIVFASGRVRVLDMVKVGLALNLVGILVTTAVFYILGTAIFGIDPGFAPEWVSGSRE